MSTLTLEVFISQLKILIDNGDSLISSIKYPKLLLSALTDLNNLIEMEEAKKSILQQLQFLIVQNAMRNPAVTFEDHLMSVVIYGPPGTGKTKLGVILAKIWTSLGIIKPMSGISSSSESEDSSSWKTKEDAYLSRIVTLRKVISVYQTQCQQIKEMSLHQHDLLSQLEKQICRVRPDVPSILRNTKETEKYRLINKEWDDIETIIRELKFTAGKISRDTSVEGSDADDVFSKKICHDESGEKEKEKDNEKEDIPIVIVSRQDLVAEYLGHTAIKTYNLLLKNLKEGKVTFIDEAYSLVTGERDTFGLEALTTLNKFMSEHPEAIIIFAGYKDLMQETIFKYQPGLKRRCAWVLEIEGYSPAGLAQIFLSQLSQHGWTLDPSINLVDFFLRNRNSFPNFGGDTGKLAFYCKLAYSDYIFRNFSTLESDPNFVASQITFPMLNSALSVLITHDTSKRPKEEIPFGMIL